MVSEPAAYRRRSQQYNPSENPFSSHLYIQTDETLYELFCPFLPTRFGPGVQERILISVRREVIASATGPY